ncbi:MAG TPA: ATP-binding protein [Candidatus Acidoferrales bacterium]|nr:ATP-binding protein [Candidatus Acidoferrales bacterium]
MADSKVRRLRRWLLGAGFVLLLGVVFILGSINVPFLEPDEPSEVILLYLFSGLVFLAFILYGLVLTRYLARLYTERRQRVLGSTFKTKMVVGALALSLLPVVALFFISYALVNRTLAKWFPRPLEIVRDDAVALVNHTLREHERHTLELARMLAEDPALQRTLKTGRESAAEETLTTLARRAGVAWAVVVRNENEIVATYQMDKVDLRHQLDDLREAAPTIIEPSPGKPYALARASIRGPDGAVLGSIAVAQPVPPEILTRAARIEQESRAYDAVTRQSKAYRWQALLILLLITILLLLATTWTALFLAKQVTIPIQALAVATEEVSRGNFDHRVEVPARDELAALVNSFNLMTAQLGENRRSLELAVAELRRRRQWMETIQESIPTAVLTLSPERTVLGANHAARQLLGRSAAQGAPLADYVGAETARACEELFTQAAHTGFAATQMDLRFPDRIAHAAVSVSALRGGPGEGFVLVLDDLTDLLKAQKAAAWQEVAQRIAHEIKNPLTPIQLSADRIRRYVERAAEAGGDNGRYRELIARCASVIGQEVHSLKSLVDEFSRFARFPSTEPVPTQLNEVVESTLVLYGEATNGIHLEADLESDLPPIPADPALLRRALINLIENATEAVAQATNKRIFIRTRSLAPRAAVELSVSDSGTGISPESKERLFLPFFSTKPDGMGLGLAIVSRIVAEHHGRIRVEDTQPSGARFVVELPTEIPATARAS